GVSISNQIKSLQKGTDILIATPGRLLDLLHQGHIDTRHIATLILDEADRMVDMGFIKDVRTIINRLPAKRQNVLFTATLSNEIRKFSQSVLLNPEVVEIESVNKHKEVIDQSIYFVSRQDKRKLLTEILKERHADNVLVFMRTKRGADRLAKTLQKSNINTASIHGDKSQNQRENALAGFKQKKIRVLVATDLAARGIDISQLPLVVNYDLPDTPETYIHRIGRTGRAGENGLAFSFCSEEDKSMLQQINRHLNTSIRVQKDHPYHVNLN
ncbi:MAG: DEAD/DEAH box helicase, partial [Bacteroidetes bacterium]|nr:DEAD/DEAH box helicase [Bacteroidota bacterium]